MENTSDTFIELKSSDVAYDDVLPQTDDLIITVSSPSYLTNDRSSGLVNEESIEQLRSVVILAQKSTSEVIDTSEPDTAGKEIKTSDAANDDVVPQNDDLIVTVPSSSTLTDNQFLGLENEKSVEQLRSVEIVAEKSTGEEIDEMPKLIKTSEPQMEDTAGKDMEIKTSDAANDDVLLQNDDLIVAVSSPLILIDNRYSGLVNGESFEKLGSVEIVANKSKVEETDEMAELITTHEPQMEDTAGKHIELKTSGASDADVLSHNDDLIVAVSSPSTLADNRSSGLVNETSYGQIGTVEIVADKSVIDETDEKPKLIKTPKPDVEGTDGKDMVIKTSIVANSIVLPQNDDLIVAVSSPYTLSNIRSSGLVNGEIFEQLGSVEIVVDKSTIEEINEMPKLMKTHEPDMEDTAGTDIKIKTFNAANDEVLPQNDDLVVAVSSPSTLADNRSSGLVNEESFEQLGSVEIVADKSEIEEIDEMPTLIKTPEPEKSGKKQKFNLRKSLAWDSAFFTSDGVLDADELSTMIEGGEKGVKHQLPGIEEEVYRSMDSISTLASDNLSLECLEAELFDNIRASIQKSNRVSNLNNSNIKVSSGKKDIQPKVSNSSKKVDLDYGKRPAARIKDNTSTMPQPKIMSRVNSTSTLSKRASLSANHAKKDQDIAKQAHVSLKGTQALKTTLGSKVTGMIGPRRGVPKPLLSSKSSMLASSTAPKMEPARPSSSCSNSSSCSSGTDIKTSTSFSRRKVDSKVGKVTAGSIPKTPSRISIKKKQPPINSRLSSQLVVSNFPSSISPASSISEWDSESSSSTSTINQRSTPRGSIDTGVSYRSSVESASSIHPTDRKSNQNGNQTAALNASQTGPLSRPPSVQPTGLRIPSPKIGFFDGGKSGVRTPNGGLRTGPTSSNGSKVGKIPPPKTAAPTNMKPNLQKTTPKLAQEQPSSKPKTSSASQGVKSFPVPQNDSYKQANWGNTSVSKIDTPDSDRVEMLKSASEVLSNECLTIVKDNKVDKPITDGSRTPFAVKNSVSAANRTEVDVTEKTVNLSFMETQHKENSELI